MAPLIEFNNELSKFIEFKVNFNHKVQYVFKFDNSYGASVLWWDAGYEVGSSGFDDNLWEVTIIRWVTSDKFTIVLHEIQGNVITRELTQVHAHLMKFLGFLKKFKICLTNLLTS